MKKILFLSVNYGIEGIEHGVGVLNGFTAFSEMLVEGLAEISSVDVVTDRPERFPQQYSINIFRGDIERSPNFENFWRQEFRVFGAASSSEFSRDTIYRLYQLANALDPQALDDLLSSEKYDVVILNRHEYFFLLRHPGLANKQVVLCAHDSNYLRKLSYEKRFGVAQPLTHVEKALEQALIADAEKLIVISHEERDYFEGFADSCEVILFRPSVSKPVKLVSLSDGDLINFYFIGVNNFVNRQTIEIALKMFYFMRGDRLGCFHVFGSVCDFLTSGSICEGVIPHGHVDNLEEALSEMHVLLAPIQTGSGVPVKISDALGAGHLVVSSAFGAASYTEFIGSRIIISDGLRGPVVEELYAAPASFVPYDEYAHKNCLAALQIVGVE